MPSGIDARSFVELLLEALRIIVSWPSVALILFGCVYRSSIRRLLKNRFKLVGFGTEIEHWGEPAISPNVLELLNPAIDDAIQPTVKALTLAQARILCDICAVGHQQQIDMTLFTEAAARESARQEFTQAIVELLEMRLIEKEGQWYRPKLRGIEVAREYLRAIGQALATQAKTGSAASP